MFMFRSPAVLDVGQETEQLKRLVAISMNFSISIAQAAEIMRYMRDADDHSRAIAAATEELATSVEVIGSRAEDAARQVGVVRGLADSGAAEASAAISMMESAAESVTLAEDRMTAFASSSKEIKSVVKQIDGIASKTALLALNAAIEAARAGDQGRAFSVVAGEVQALAEQTLRATEDIRQRIDSLLDGLAMVVEAVGAAARQVADGKAQVLRSSAVMVDTAEGIRAVSDHVEEIAGAVTQQSSAAQTISTDIIAVHEAAEGNTVAIGEVLRAMRASSDLVAECIAAATKDHPERWPLYLAKSDHLLWRQCLAEMMVGVRPLPDSEVVDHRGCRFGRWYLGVTDPTILQHSAFIAIDQPHSLVHAAARQAVACLRENDMDGALFHVEALASASDKVVGLLDQLIAAEESAALAKQSTKPQRWGWVQGTRLAVWG